MSKLGRKPLYTEELADKVCNYIACGLTLAKIGAMDDMPSRATIMNWCLDNELFLEQYTRAKVQQAEAFAEELVELSNAPIDEKLDDPAQMNAAVQARKLQIETRKWVMGKMKPKKYGESSLLKMADNEGGKLTLGNIMNEIDGSTSEL